MAFTPLVKVFQDPELKEMWEQEALREGERKTEFGELMIGTTFADDGPKPSQQVPAAPILYYNKLQRMGAGRKVNIEMKHPLYTSVTDILHKWVYSQQDRIGSEQEAERTSVATPVDLLFLALKEEQVKQGYQETANADEASLMRYFVQLLSDNTVKRMDVGAFWSLAAGYDMHHFTNVGLRNGIASGDKPEADEKAGVFLPPTEHPNMFVYHNNDVNKVPYSSTQATHSDNIDAEVAKIDGTAAGKPGLNFVRRMYRVAWDQNIIPAQMRVNGQMKEYYVVYVPGSVKDLIEKDADFMDLYSRAYMGQVRDNPLIQNNDLMYKNLIIKDSKWLSEDYFDGSASFNATGGVNTTDMALTTSNNWWFVNPGERTAEATTPLADAGITTSDVGRCYLLGANALIRATGTDYALERMEVTDYGNNDGIGQDKYFGQNRVDAVKLSGSNFVHDSTSQSICFLVDKSF